MAPLFLLAGSGGDRGLGSLETLVRDRDFHSAFIVAAIAAVVVGIAALIHGSPLPLGGLVAAGALVYALQETRPTEVPDEVLIGVGLLAVASLVTFGNQILPLHAIAALPGALLVGSSLPGVPFDWTQPFVVVAIVVAAPLVVDFDRAFARTAWAGPLIAVSAFGVWACVPDAERSIPLVAATLPLLVLAWPRPLATLGPPGAYALVGLFVWIAAVEGRGRAGSIIGAVGCLGVLLVEPLVRRMIPLGGRRMKSSRGELTTARVATGVLHVGVVFVCARVAGFRSSASEAAMITAVTLIAAAIVLAAWRLRQRHVAHA
jgi:hypothetical protein